MKLNIDLLLDTYTQLIPYKFSLKLIWVLTGQEFETLEGTKPKFQHDLLVEEILQCCQ